MRYIERNSLYVNYDVKSYLKNNLPMEEFRNGNFSQAHKIIDVHREYVLKCIENIAYRKTDWKVNKKEEFFSYKSSELVRLNALFKKEEEEKEAIQKKIDEERIKIKQYKEGLKKEWVNDKIWNTLFDFLNKHCHSYISKNSFSIEILENAFERTAEDTPDKYNEAKPTFEKFVTCAKVCIEKINESNDIITWLKKQIKSKGVDSNYVAMKINETKRLESEILEEISSLFRKGSENKSLEEISINSLVADLIIDSKTNKKTKMDLIRNYDDKLWLFCYIWNIYNEESSIFFNIYTNRTDYSTKSFLDLKQDSITTVMNDAREILNKISDHSMVWISYMAKEKKDIFDKVAIREYKEHIINDLVSHLWEVLNETNKTDNWDDKKDPKLSTLFECVYDITESHEFEKFCEQIWMLDRDAYRYLLWVEGQMILQQIFLWMNQKDRDILKENYSYEPIFKKIEEDALNIEKQKAGEQLLLFPLPEPLFPIKWYSKQVVKNILELVWKLPNGWERKMNYIVSHILIKQWIDEYFNPSLPLPELTNELFLEELKTSKRSKEMYNKMKKITGNIFPDIKERIEHQKEVE